MMKRVGNIYENIIDINNIKLAILNASKKKKNRASVKRVMRDLDRYVLEIHNMLKSETYTPSQYYKQIIIDNSSCKERVVYKPNFYPDQIIHWAIMQVIEPILIKGMYHYCCGSVKGRGGKRGFDAVKRWISNDKKHTKYCLQIDVSKFYPSINQEILMRKLCEKIKDSRCLNLLGLIVRSTSEGLPIGNYTSQWFANFYLQDLDHFIKEELKIKYMIRYMDDIVMFGNNKRKLHKAKKEIEVHLDNLELKVKGNWQVFRLDSRPLDFLGYRFYRDHITLRRRNSLRIRRRAKKINNKGYVTYRDAAAMMSYLGWICHSDSYKYFKKNIEPYINIEEMKEVIRNESRKQYNAQRGI